LQEAIEIDNISGVQYDQPIAALFDAWIVHVGSPSGLTLRYVMTSLHQRKSFEIRGHLYGFLVIISWWGRVPIKADYDRPASMLALEPMKHIPNGNTMERFVYIPEFGAFSGTLRQQHRDQRRRDIAVLARLERCDHLLVQTRRVAHHQTGCERTSEHRLGPFRQI